MNPSHPNHHPVREHEGLPGFLTDMEGVEKFDEARIASKLTTLLPAPVANATLCVVGSDGPNIHQREYLQWRELLRTRLRGGCIIKYLLVDQDPQHAITALRDMAQECAGDPGKLLVYRLRAGEAEANALAEELATQHFVLIDQPLRIWYEGHHAKGSTTATGCYFFGEKAARDSGFAAVLEAKFEHALKHSDRVL